MKKQKPQATTRPAKRPVRTRPLRADPSVVDALVAAARDDLVTFVQICFFILKPTTKLLMNWNIMTFTDCPYNVSIREHARGLGRSKHREFAIASGELSDAEFLRFLQTAFWHITDVSVDGNIVPLTT